MNIFLTSQASKVLDKIVPMLEKTASEMSVAFIPTAGDVYGDVKPWMYEDRGKLVELGFKVIDFNISGKTEKEVKEVLESVDVIFIAGGNTFYLLERMRQCGADKIIKELVQNGKIYIGSSAGSCVAGPNIEPIAVFDDPSVVQLKSTEGLGLVDFVVLPHADNPKYAEIQEKVMKDFREKYNIKKITDEEWIGGKIL